LRPAAPLNFYNPPVPSRARSLFTVWLFPVLLGFPFIGRGFLVDDHYHLLMARGLRDHPLRPYDFRADDAGPGNAGWERGQPPRMVNPPLHHYLMVLFDGLGGGRLWVLRLGMLAVAALAAVFVYLLAGRFLIPRGPAAALAALTPAFWVSSYGLLIDSTLLVFFLGALWAWMEALEKKSLGWSLAAGAFMGAAILTKYTGGFVGILALALWWRERPRPWRILAGLVVPVGFMVLWTAWNMATYGACHFTESSKRVLQTWSWTHGVTFLSFFSGSLGLPLLAWEWVRRRGPTPFGLAVLAATGLAFFFFRGGFTRGQSFLLAFFVLGGVLFFGETLATWRRSRAPGDGFLALWLALAAVQMMAVMQWVAARYYLTLLPPVVFLTLRRLRQEAPFSPVRFARKAVGVGAALLVLGGAVATGDYLQARAHEKIGADVGGVPPGSRRYYTGDSFTDGALKSRGWSPLFPATVLLPGDLVLRQRVVMPAYWFTPDPRRFRAAGAWTYPSWFPLRVMDNDGSAGFYASVWGALPYSFTFGPLEKYVLLEVLPNL
jgi:hypothetical protein